MKCYSVVIIDDEPDAGILLKNLLHHHKNIKVKSVHQDALKALDEIIGEQVPLVFADIEMPELSGLELLKQINKYSPKTKIVFVTAYEQYALEALQNDAFDFLCKPVGREDLRRVVHKFSAHFNDQKEENAIADDRVLIKTSEGYHYLSVEEVAYLEADSNYTTLYMKNDKKLLTSMTLGKVSELFPSEDFVRISRKHVVNKKILTFVNFNKKYCLVSLNGVDNKLEISVKMKDFKEEISR